MNKNMRYRSEYADTFVRIDTRSRVAHSGHAMLLDLDHRLKEIEARFGLLAVFFRTTNVVTAPPPIESEIVTQQSSTKIFDKHVALIELKRVNGIGDARACALLDTFGSLSAIDAATSEEICSRVKGINRELAVRVKDHVHNLFSN